ncbi:hypothetical protein [Mycobacterium sp.]|uniref:hypothetical protein n=1 Tax=Mycobacterium sp. TaxID=1785 RepID=UPI003D6BC38D
MTSQLTREHSTTRPAASQHRQAETPERIYLQPWFWLAVLCVIAGVLMVVFN